MPPRADASDSDTYRGHNLCGDIGLVPLYPFRVGFDCLPKELCFVKGKVFGVLVAVVACGAMLAAEALPIIFFADDKVRHRVFTVEACRKCPHPGQLWADDAAIKTVTTEVGRIVVSFGALVVS